MSERPSEAKMQDALQDLHSCLCGWRSESPQTHPHVTGCPIDVLACFARATLEQGDARSLLADLTWQFALHETDREGNSTGWVSTGARNRIEAAFRYFGVPGRCEVGVLREALFGDKKE